MVTKCTICGADNPDGARLCVKCRATLPAPPVGWSAGPRFKWTLAIASLVLGLLVYVAGASIYAIRWALYGWLPSDWHLYEASVFTKDIGVILVILGLVFYVVEKRKGV